jgi:hypothetical protein
MPLMKIFFISIISGSLVNRSSGDITKAFMLVASFPADFTCRTLKIIPGFCIIRSLRVFGYHKSKKYIKTTACKSATICKNVLELNYFYYTTSYPMGTGLSFLGGKAAGA